MKYVTDVLFLNRFLFAPIGETTRKYSMPPGPQVSVSAPSDRRRHDRKQKEKEKKKRGGRRKTVE